MSIKYTFLDAACMVLKGYGQPLSVKDIATLAVNQGLIESSGDTPFKTFSSKLSGDILQKKNKSVFMRVAEGTFALREWADRFSEYSAERYVKKLYDEEIAVFDSKKLSSIIKKNGLSYLSSDFSDLLREHIFPYKRANAEQTFDVVQLVSVFIVTFNKKLFTHMRSARLPESRLHGEYSLMLGGHLGMDDFSQVEMQFESFSSEGALVDGSLLRELSEELIIHSVPEISRIGLLYDPSRNVSKQHLGLVYLVKLNDDSVHIGEKGFLMNPKFESIDEIMARRSDFENWSHILMDEYEVILNGTE